MVSRKSPKFLFWVRALAPPQMAILKVRKYKDPVLRQKAREVKKIDEEILKLGEDMIETMTDHNGIGLAANQVGVLKRIIIIRSQIGKIC